MAKSSELTNKKVTTKEKTNQKTGAKSTEKLKGELKGQTIVESAEISERTKIADTAKNEKTIGEKESSVFEEKAENKEPISFENAFITLDDSVEKGKNILKSTENIIVNLYEEYFENRGFAYTKEQILVNFEEYLQSLLLVQSMENKDLSEEELRFIWSVMSKADIFTGHNGMDECLQKAVTTVKNTPYGILISVAVDKVYDKKETQVILSNIYNLYLILCLLAGIKPISKNKLLENLIAFAKTQGVK